MLNMKSKVLALLTKDIKRMKVIGRNGKKDGGHRTGEIVSISIKEGKFANAVSKPGTKHKAIIATSRFRKNSQVSPGIMDIVHNKSYVLLFDPTKKSSIFSLNALNMRIDGGVKMQLERMSRLAKRKEELKFAIL